MKGKGKLNFEANISVFCFLLRVILTKFLYIIIVNWGSPKCVYNLIILNERGNQMLREKKKFKKNEHTRNICFSGGSSQHIA